MRFGGTAASKIAFLMGVSNLAFAAPAFAQEEAVDDQPIVVTGSRIVENGYQAPTPVSVATAEDLAMSSPTSISDGLRKMPQLIGSLGPNSQSNIFIGTPHGNVLNMRGLGPNRTLILLDGVRVSPTTYTNLVDVDILPQLLVQRVEIVTAGASASYGSDAVAGVVNYILDTDFNGVKGVAQAGRTQRDDAINERLGIAFGTDVGERGHFLVSGEYYRNSGYLLEDRPRLNDSGMYVGSVVGSTAAPGTPANPLIPQADVRASFVGVGGIATSGPFANTTFVSAGLYRPTITGSPTGSGYVFGAPSDYYTLADVVSAAGRIENFNSFARLSYDLGATSTAYVQAVAARSKIGTSSIPNLMAFPAAQFFSGNAFLPTALQDQLSATNTNSFAFVKMFSELGAIQTREEIDNYSGQAGVSGELGEFSWQVDFVHAKSTHDFYQFNQFNMPHLYAAIDAVVNPANGQIACNASLSTDPTIAAKYASCVPFNAFGFNAASPGAVAYVTEGASQFEAVNTTNNISGSIAGNLFELPAGPLSIVIGGEYHTASLRVTSNGNPAEPPDFTGLRGVTAPTHWYLTNQSVMDASQDVVEGFGELAVPVLSDIPFIQALDLNAAIRLTHYSTAGTATTWRIGGIWSVNDDLSFRATRSRDIRAPTLYDLYNGRLFGSGFHLDPHTGVNLGYLTISGGNPDLIPEVGNTFTVGLVFQPDWLDGFSLSIDYYSIRMSDVITTLSGPALIDDCFASGGTAPSCANVTRPLPYSDRTQANYPTSVFVTGTNISAVKTEGIDFDLSYRTDLAGGKLTSRIYATYVDNFRTQLSGQQPLIDYAGWNAAGSGGVSGAVPKIKASLSLDYEIGDFEFFVQENVIGKLKLGPPSVLTYVDSSIPAFLTTDLTVTWNAPPIWKANTEFFATVTNLFEATPPLVYSNAVPHAGGLNTIIGLYDTTGRAFVAGLRFDL